MGDYKFIASAFMDETCCICAATIRKGDGLYYEREKRKIHCVPCGRMIRAKGEEETRRTRGSVEALFRNIFSN